MSKALKITLLVFFLISGAFYAGGAVQRFVQPYPDLEAHAEEVLGEAGCIRFGIIVPGPQGSVKVGEQVMCGYHLEWSGIGGGGSTPEEFRPGAGRDL